jgi:hypothetical protein
MQPGQRTDLADGQQRATHVGLEEGAQVPAPSTSMDNSARQAWAICAFA